MGDGVVDDLVQSVQKIAHAARRPAGGIEPAVVLHADVNVGEVDDTDGVGHRPR
jgi:hypothetical protein